MKLPGWKASAVVLTAWLASAAVVACHGDTAQYRWLWLWSYCFGYVAVWFWPTFLIYHAASRGAPVIAKTAVAAVVATGIGWATL